jgi:hypothetical protein
MFVLKHVGCLFVPRRKDRPLTDRIIAKLATLRRVDEKFIFNLRKMSVRDRHAHQCIALIPG